LRLIFASSVRMFIFTISAKKYQIKTTRIAHGIPLGGELEYTDINTIAHALSSRKSYDI